MEATSAPALLASLTDATPRFTRETLPGLSRAHANVQPLKHAPPLSGRGRPLFASPVACGAPAPADADEAAVLDLHELLVRTPEATFFVRASGDSMTGAGIYDGDLCVVDRSAEPRHGKIVIADVDGEVTMKRYVRVGGHDALVPENASYPTLRIRDYPGIRFLGVVTYTIRQHG